MDHVILDREKTLTGGQHGTSPTLIDLILGGQSSERMTELALSLKGSVG